MQYYDGKSFQQPSGSGFSSGSDSSPSYDPNAQPAAGLWIVGESGSGKTAGLIQQLTRLYSSRNNVQNSPAILVFAASRANRSSLEERLTAAGLPLALPQIQLATPIGWFEAEVVQFWPLLTQVLAPLGLSLPPNPLRLRPEKEQELATQLWQSAIDSGRFRQPGLSSAALVNQALGFLQLAANSGTPHEQIALILQDGLPTPELAAPDSGTLEPTLEPNPAARTTDLWNCTGELLEGWVRWCLTHGLLTYSILTELYWRYLLPHPRYIEQLEQRYWAVLADDVDEYPAVMRTLLEGFLRRGPLVCTFNPIGAVRLGLRADPVHLAGLAAHCRVETLEPRSDTLGYLGQSVAAGLQNPLQLLQLPETIQLIQTTTKAQLLRQVADQIATAIRAGQIQPSEIAIVAPGLDAITRYTLHSILASQQIPLLSLNSQQPLVTTATVRALLSWMALVYPGLGRLVERETLAEMLVVLGQRARLDPVRAGLIADHCFLPDLIRPQLLPVTEFPRWDRLGYEATTAYTELRERLEAERQQFPHPVACLEQNLRRYFPTESLPFDQQIVVQQLVETAQHYWEIEARLQLSSDQDRTAMAASVGRFIQLLRSGTITANASASASASAQPQAAVVLATVYQYRNQHSHHRWQFWLDAGSPLWLTGGVLLPAAPLFLRERPNRIWTAADSLTAHQANLEREVRDLLSRTAQRVYLCHCELGINGEDQSDGLMALVNAAVVQESSVSASARTLF
ncbi:MAG: recombinase family protein [Elainella sp.]